MPFAVSIRRKLESDGFEIEMMRNGEFFQVRAEKDGKAFIAMAESLTTAYLEVVSLIRSKGEAAPTPHSAPKHPASAPEGPRQCQGSGTQYA